MFYVGRRKAETGVKASSQHFKVEKSRLIHITITDIQLVQQSSEVVWQYNINFYLLASAMDKNLKLQLFFA